LAGIGTAIKGQLTDMDDMSKAASKIGIPIGELSQLRYAADMSGVSMETLSTAVKKMSTTMADAAGGGKSAVSALAQFGLSATNSQGGLKTAGEMLREISDKFAAMPDGVQKSAAAVALFGKSGLDMIPMLNGGANGLAEMMQEADALGLTLTTETGRAAEQFNDNISRLGYAASGLATQMTAALAPALAKVTDGMVIVMREIAEGIRALPNFADEIAVVGGAVALAFSPALVSSIGAVSTAISVGLVNALRGVAVVAAANPLGLFAIGVAGAALAAYKFRDAIKESIGVDVISVVKGGANMIINSFRAAFEDIKFVWNSFPDIIGAATIGAINAVVGGIQTMIKTAIGELNSFVTSANSILSTIGAEIPAIPMPDFKGQALPNDYAKRLATAVADRNSTIAKIMQDDPIGNLGQSMKDAFKPASDALKDWNNSLKGVGDQIDTTAGKASRAGAATKDPWAGLRESTKQAKSGLEDMQSSMAGVTNGLGSGIADLIKGTKSLGDVMKEMVAQFAQMEISRMFGGNTSGGFGGFFSSLFSGLTGFANGGTILPGGAGGIDSQVVAFKKSPGEQVDIYKPGQQRSSGGGTVINQTINAPNADLATVAQLKRTVDDLNRNFNKRAVSAQKSYNTRRTI
jgi:hypothetical protein